MRWIRVLLLVPPLLACSLPVRGQSAPSLAPAGIPLAFAPDTVVRHSTGALVLGGGLGWVVGVLGGGFLGAGVETSTVEHCYDWCGVGGFIIGAVLGESLLVPLGVHIANGRQGAWGKATVVSLGIAVAGLALAPVTAGVSILPVLPVQVGVSIRIERNTARRRAGGR